MMKLLNRPEVKVPLYSNAAKWASMCGAGVANRLP